MVENNNIETVIIGGGFGGISAAIELKKKKRNDFIILDSQDDLGGVWQENKYPGCSADMPGVLFGFRDEPLFNLGFDQPSRNDVVSYLKFLCNKYNIGPEFRHNVDVDSLAWDEHTGRWSILTNQGAFTARFVIMSSGSSGNINTPNIPGLDAFKGRLIHTANWPDDVDNFDKDTVVVGTGASAIQIIPHLAKVCKSLTIMQRTPRWILPKYRIKFIPKFLQRKALLKATGNLLESFVDYNARPLIEGNEKKLRKLDARYKKVMRKNVGDNIDHAEVMPKAPFGCSRSLFSSEYFPTLRLENVHLTSAVQEVGERSVLDKDGNWHPADNLILATGYNRFERNFDIFGRRGISIFEQWEKKGPLALMGVFIENMPNLIFMSGPNSGILNSAPRALKEQAILGVRMIVSTIEAGDIDYFEPSTDSVDRYMDTLRPILSGSIWAKDFCNAWYVLKGREGAVNPVIFPNSLEHYRRLSREFNVGNLILS